MKRDVKFKRSAKDLLITYIIPCYNAEQNILRLLKSIDLISIIDYEIICVDDGSADNTYNMIKEYSQEHCNVQLIHQRNQGVSKARNTGINMARGKYIVFADSDDEYFRPYSDLVNGSSEDQLIVFDFVERSPNGCKVIGCLTDAIYSTHEYIEKIANIDDMLYFNSCWNKVYRTDIVKAIGGFDENINLGEDALFNYEYLCNCSKVRISKNCHYIYNNFSMGSLSRRAFSIDILWQCYSTIADSFTKLCRYYECDKKANEIFSGYYLGTINAFITKEHVDEKEISIIRAMINDSNCTKRIVSSNKNINFNYILSFMLKLRLRHFAFMLILLRRKI